MATIRYPVRWMALVLITPFLQVFAQDTSHVAILKLSLEELMQLQVATATRYRTAVADAPAPVVVITEQQIQERGYRSLLDVLHDVPGFDFTHVNGLYPQLIHQRGLRGNNNRTLIFIDGVPDQNLYEMNMLGASLDFDLTGVKQIEILYGPASALYGANAFSGVINIVTKTGRELQGRQTVQFGARLYQATAERSGMTGSFALGGYQEAADFSWAISGSIKQDDGYYFGKVQDWITRRPPRGSAFTVNYDNSWVQAYQVQIRLRWKRLELQTYNWLYRMGQGTFNNGFWVFDHPVQDLQIVLPDGTVRTVDLPVIQWAPENHSLRLSYQTRFRPRWEVRSSITYRSTRLRPRSFDAESGPVEAKALTLEKDSIPAADLFAVFYRRFSSSLRSEHWLSWEHAPPGKLTVGVQFEKMNVPLDYETRRLNPQTGVFDGWRLQPRVKILNLAGFFQEDYRLGPHWRLFAGLRVDYYRYDVQDRRYGDAKYTTWNPRISLIYKASASFYTKLFLGTAFRTPTPWELFSSTYFRVPNPRLKPEKKRTVELEIHRSWKDGVQVTVNGYLQQARDLIINSVSLGEGDRTQNQNIGEVIVSGLEVRARWVRGASFAIDGNLTFQDPRYRSVPLNLVERIAAHDGVHVPDLARYKANMVVTYRRAPIVLAVRNNWVGDRETIGTNPLPRVDGYWRTHLVVTLLPFGSRTVRVQAGVENLFNTPAWDPGLRAANGWRFPARHPVGGRIFWVRIQYGSAS